MAATDLTLYFAWVAPTQTTFDPTLARFDEHVFRLEIEHLEGQIPTATVEVINPRVGLLNPGRSNWAWISYQHDTCPAAPLFFGRLVSVPTNILNNTITLQLIARLDSYTLQKQQVAESLKTLPNYDPIFFTIPKRDDPDAILEGWSCLYHVDRASGFVSTSDILIGEDGTVTFDPEDVFYDSVEMKLLQAPLTAVNVKAEVQWEQQYRDYLYVGSWAWPTLGQDAFVGEWPKTGSNLGGGWTAGVTWAGERDPPVAAQLGLTTQPSGWSYSYSWQNLAKTHADGDTMSIDVKASYSGLSHSLVVKSFTQSGFIDPFAVDSDGLPAPINIPARSVVDYFDYTTFALNFQGKESLATLGLTYQADRKRSERLELTVVSDTQPVLFDPQDVQQYTEQVTLASGDLSLPSTNLLNWTTVGGGGAVILGQVIFPDNPNIPGQTSSQIAVQAGNTGATVPNFSNVAGQTTADGTVIWSSLGGTQPTEGSQDWSRDARIALGTLLIPKPVSGVPDINSVGVAGALNYPPTGVALAVYTVLTTGVGGPGATMYEVTAAGLLGGSGPQCTLQTFTNPSGQDLYICTQAGTTGDFHPTFDDGPNATTTDGSVTWQHVGAVSLPIGGWPGMTPASSYFPTTRGLLSLEHALCRARAKLRRRARAVQITFDTRFEVAAMLSCRMNGLITDPRLPGGAALGKVVAYKLSVDGDTGRINGNVTLGCSVGHVVPAALIRDAAVPLATIDPGVPSYVAAGYVGGNYQQLTATPGWTPPPGWTGNPNGPPIQGVTFNPPPPPPGLPPVPPTLPPPGCPTGSSSWATGPTEASGNQIGYQPPTSIIVDDGVPFPAAPGDLILRNQWHGLPSTLNPGNIALYNLQLQTTITQAIASANRTLTTNVSVPGAAGVATSVTIPVDNTPAIQAAVQQAILQNFMQGTGLWYELVLKNLNGGPYAGAYVVSTSNLAIPQTIDLAAP